MVSPVDIDNDSERQQYLDFLARVEQTFTPFAPIELPDFFVGRTKEVQNLIRELSAPGRQVAIYGDRGVGKTSLAWLCWFFARRPEEHTYFVRATTASTYQDIFAEVLRKAAVTHVPADRETSKVRNASAGMRGIHAGRSTQSSIRERAINGAYRVSPGFLLETFKDVDGLIIVDEFDRVQDASTHVQLAETLKHFSDARSKTKILIVGVAETLSQLLHHHESLTRCVAEIRLDRMPPEELRGIVAAGEKRLNIDFDPTVTDKIVALSDGYAHYAHLLARSSALIAAYEAWSPGSSLQIGKGAYEEGLQHGMDNAELRLREGYQRAIIPLKKKTQLFQYVVWAVAMGESLEVHISDIARHMSDISGDEVKPQRCTYHLSKLAADDRGRILQRVREGYYKFRDPLMRPYVRLQLEAYNILERRGQLVFGFMKTGKGATRQGWAPIRNQ